MGDVSDWIQTYTGRKVYPLNLRVEDIDVRDIAHALANQCRFAGHARFHYSVAQHSVLVANYILDSTGDREVARWGILHDASEAYLTDLPRPLKRHPALAFYRGAEKSAQRVICDRFGLPQREPEAVKVADLVLLVTEARDVMSPLHPDWEHQVANGYTALDDVIRPWLPEQAEEAFLATFERFGGGRG